MTTETTELGLEVQVLEQLTSLRSQCDGSRLSPAAKLAISAMLSLPGIKVDQVATALGCHWMTIVAVREQCRGAIEEFKRGLSVKLQSAVELALPGLMEDAKGGKLTVFDLKLLIDSIMQLNDQPNIRVSITHQPSEEILRLMRLCEGAPAMGLERGKMAAIGAGLEPGLEPVTEAVLVPQGGNQAP